MDAGEGVEDRARGEEARSGAASMATFAVGGAAITTPGDSARTRMGLGVDAQAARKPLERLYELPHGPSSAGVEGSDSP
jgi:hypothetical protein